jgi:hypothetical protein
MATGALPAVDRQIMLFERWYQHRLSEITDSEHAQLLLRFTVWRLPGLHTRAVRAPLTAGSRNVAAGYFNAAAAFLTWLADYDRALQAIDQADIDRWHVDCQGTDRVHPFLKWAMTSGQMPRLDLPVQLHNDRAPISQDQRLRFLRCVLTDDTIELRTRVAACLLLLYAQHISRLVQLTIHDISDHDDEMLPTATPHPAPPGAAACPAEVLFSD